MAKNNVNAVIAESAEIAESTVQDAGAESAVQEVLQDAGAESAVQESAESAVQDAELQVLESARAEIVQSANAQLLAKKQAYEAEIATISQREREREEIADRAVYRYMHRAEIAGWLAKDAELESALFAKQAEIESTISGTMQVLVPTLGQDAVNEMIRTAINSASAKEYEALALHRKDDPANAHTFVSQIAVHKTRSASGASAGAGAKESGANKHGDSYSWKVTFAYTPEQESALAGYTEEAKDGTKRNRFSLDRDLRIAEIVNPAIRSNKQNVGTMANRVVRSALKNPEIAPVYTKVQIV